jgi:hypothetical protein
MAAEAVREPWGSAPVRALSAADEGRRMPTGVTGKARRDPHAPAATSRPGSDGSERLTATTDGLRGCRLRR